MEDALITVARLVVDDGGGLLSTAPRHRVQLWTRRLSDCLSDCLTHSGEHRTTPLSCIVPPLL